MLDTALSLLVVVNLVAAVVSFRKGRMVLMLFGLAGLIPTIAWLGIPAWVGALSRAKPGSEWAQTKYGKAKHEAVSSSQQQPPAAQADPPVKPPAIDLGENERRAVLRFLESVESAGVVDRENMVRLRFFLDQLTPPAAGKVAVPPVEAPDPEPAAPVKAPPVSPPAPAPTPAEPPAPVPEPAPSPLNEFLSTTWEAVASDIALHGLSYFGVVLTFVGVLGFLLFAFVDVPDAVQPVVELLIASVFFGWAWMLRRQGADQVASGMELLGGMVVPLILFASLVDEAPFPPDLTGSAPVVGLPLAALLLSVIYAWISRRNPESTLRFLVLPLVWLAALAAGFAFKTDEPLVSTAITRLVSPQPALAGAAVALTVAAFLVRREHRLAAPTVRAALFALPFTYLLTVSLSVGESWVLTWPIVLMGLSTIVAAEGLARWFARTEWLGAVRPVLAFAVLGSLIPSVGAGWVGLIGVVVYISLVELEQRRDASVSLAWLLASIGAGASLSATAAEPITMLVGFAIAASWAHLRRGGSQSDDRRLILSWAAALLPIGIWIGVDRLAGGDLAVLIMAGVVVVAAALIRAYEFGDLFTSYWILGASSLLAVAAVRNWVLPDASEFVSPAALVVVAAALGLERRWPILRFWLATAALLGAVAMFLEAFGVGFEQRQAIWAAIGLTAVVVALFRKLDPGAQLSAVGHLVSAGTLISLVSGGAEAVVLGGWTAGWVVAAVGDGLELNTISSVLRKAAGRLQISRASKVIDWLVPTLLVISLPFGLLAVVGLWPEFGRHRSWTGLLLATVGLTYAMVAHRLGGRRRLRRSLQWGAVATSIIGVSVAAPDPWPTIFAAVALIAVAALLSRELGQGWLSWLGWLMTLAVAMLLAGQLGVPGGSLHLVALIWGGVLLIGGLLADDWLSGRREIGEGLRIGWLRFPVILGALVTPVSLAPEFIAEPARIGWWSVGTSLAYFIVAWLTRVGAVTAPAYALGATGITMLAPWPVLSDPWMLVFIAAPLVAVSFIAESRQSDSNVGWLRWDQAPLVVATGIGVVSIAFGIGGDVLAPAALAFGLLSMAIGIFRHRAWTETGNALVLLAAWSFGMGWLAVGLAGTSVRGMLGVWRAAEGSKDSYRAISVLAAGSAWPAFLAWSTIPPVDQGSVSMLVFGGAALVVAALGRWRGLARETMLWWGALSVGGVLVTGLLVVAPSGPGLEGPWAAVGLAILAFAFDLSWTRIGRSIRYAAVPTAAASWVALAFGLGWDGPAFSQITAVAFGLISFAVAEVARTDRQLPGSDAPLSTLARTWWLLGAGGVVVAALLALGDLSETGFMIAAGLGAMGVSAARGAAPLAFDWMRDVACLATLAAVLSGSVAMSLSSEAIAVVILLAGAFGTAYALFLWSRRSASPWVRPWLVLAVAANAGAAMAALGLGSQPLWTGVLLSVGSEAVAVGYVLRWAGVLALGPPLLGAGFILAVSGSVSGTPQWFTAPAGLTLLAEVEIFRLMPLSSGERVDRNLLAVLEWIGLTVVVAPSLVEMFTRSLFTGLVALLAGLLVFFWGVATRLRRRVVTAAALVVSTLVLMIFAGAARQVPDSAFFWIVAIGIGFAVMLVAGTVEAFRASRGRALARMYELMEGWE